MNDFKFTKALLNQTSATTTSNLHNMTDMARLERIHDNMAGINPITKEVMNNQKPQPVVEPKVEDQTNQLRDQINALNSVKTTND